MRWRRNAWELHRLVAASVSRERRGQRAGKAGYESRFSIAFLRAVTARM